MGGAKRGLLGTKLRASVEKDPTEIMEQMTKLLVAETVGFIGRCGSRALSHLRSTVYVEAALEFGKRHLHRFYYSFTHLEVSV